MPDTDRASVLRSALRAVIVGDADMAADLFTDDVVGWSPNLIVFSKSELLAAVADREDALTDVELTIDAVDVVGDKAIAEWRAAAVFSGPFLVDEDILVEPNGAQLSLAGVTVAEFDGSRIRAFRNYFDDAALLEQMLTTA